MYFFEFCQVKRNEVFTGISSISFRQGSSWLLLILITFRDVVCNSFYHCNTRKERMSLTIEQITGSLEFILFKSLLEKVFRLNESISNMRLIYAKVSLTFVKNTRHCSNAKWVLIQKFNHLLTQQLVILKILTKSHYFHVPFSIAEPIVTVCS